MRFFLFLISILFIFSSCKDPKTNIDFELNSPGVYIINEGNFTYGNSSLSYIDFSLDTIFNNIFYLTTNYPLGDIAQSMTIYNSQAFIVINNSGKIYVIDNKTGKYIATINGLTSPRNILITSDTKAYISDLYSNNITIVNPTTFEKTGIIDVGCTTEAMVKLDDYVYVTNWNKGNKLLKINSITDKIEKSIELNKQPNSLIVDKNKNIWVLSDGGQNIDTALNDFPALTQINPIDLSIKKQILFPEKETSPSHLCINTTKDSLFYIQSSWTGSISDGGIYKISINSSILPTNALINQEKRIFYSMAVNKQSQIIVSDAIDYVQQGNILFYSSDGELIKSYKGGIIPGYFLFNE